MDLDILYKVGVLLGGCSALCASLTGIYALRYIQNRQLKSNWLDGFVKLYSEYWNDQDVQQVRIWIASDVVYEEVRPVFLKRLSNDNNLNGRNVLDYEENLTLRGGFHNY